MPEVLVNCLSGQQFRIDVAEEDTIDVLRELIATRWSEKIFARNVCVLSPDGEVRPGTSRIDAAEVSAIVSLQSPLERDWNTHSDTIQTLPQDVHIVFVGDGREIAGKQGGVGKTSLVFRCRDCLGTGTGWTGMGRMNGSGHLREDGTVFFNNCEYPWKDSSGTMALMSLSDASCSISAQRNGYYETASVVLILFSLANRTTFENVPKWRQEAREIPVVLIGTKLDLCETAPLSSCVAVQEAQAMARDIGALDYIECSALSGAGVDEVIDGAMWALLMDAQTERGKHRIALHTSRDRGCRVM
ncbi:Ras-related protein Rac1 [Durusdinium trenchii]|uniref:Ras-related protein Rac1 n=1 Tax=Durusdinium trenchii TaxID=1381693 RepID=A0ABP0QD97_9DINO